MRLEAILELLNGLPGPDATAGDAAMVRQTQLTKPAGSLGRLEEIAIWLATWQGKHPPSLDHPQIIVFAGNHGVAANGVSAYPTDVTAQMVANFEAGGAAINALSQHTGAALSIVPLNLDQPTADFTTAPAMSEHELISAFNTGRDAIAEDTDILLLGEMGIGNTTVAAALACVLFGGTAAEWVGRGTGVDEAGIKRKQETVEMALRLHGSASANPLEALRRLGGRELAAIAGACLEGRRRRIPVILDGYVSTVAAAVWAQLEPGALDHCLVGHTSAEPGHQHLLEHLDKHALLDLDMRLGEASGAALALSVVKAALRTHTDMATFTDAGVDGRSA